MPRARSPKVKSITSHRRSRAAVADTGFATISEAIEEFQQGRFAIIADDDERENEGDLCIPAEFVTDQAIAFMLRYTTGIICVPLTGERLDRLRIPLMVGNNQAQYGTAFTVSVDARDGITTGVSAADRARTIQVLADPRSQPSDLVMPGHIYPLRARDGGILVRAGHTEATVDLCKMAGLQPAAVLCELMNADGTMMRGPGLIKFARKHGLKVISINQLIRYRVERERLVERVAATALPTKWGDFTLYAYRSEIDPDEHAALVMGDISGPDPVLVRVHSQCVTGDVFGSMRCDCGEQMEMALAQIAAEGRGVFVYMRQEGRGIGFHNKVKAYALQEQGMDTVEANEALGFAADRRDYGIGMQVLVDLGLQKIKLITNNPAKRAGLEGYGLEVVERVPVMATPNPHNWRYLETKRDKLGHFIDMPVG
jgi:3,4-dihydroxy 2-butanone 4-phosphate synthase/GTP cyclohydrolase II